MDKVEEMIGKIWNKAKIIQHKGQKYIQRLILRNADDEHRKFCTYSHKSTFHILTKRALAAGADEQETTILKNSLLVANELYRKYIL